ncbi:Hypothetical Protein FCC1311_042592 [Hondaea fermentalgiana]|uniref:Uncharacterized protein n=1 Tax=Hondaea fermentalgiana TaxID=2315210 RepID=A0A2R5GAH4_9STRA|nr:Hypothetical Protein FCC1311_042592 [Hondaea fermentalgiana]|eukprot:GBG28036.1 Hypothetical Protein FCC1311_042592 [Hondaea fermentalgiana]
MPWLEKSLARRLADGEVSARELTKEGRSPSSSIATVGNDPEHDAEGQPADEDRDILFIHVPRCGGTSLTKLFKVPQKAAEYRGLYHKVGLKYFFYRYGLLEKANFPFFTIENFIVCCSLGISTAIWYSGLIKPITPLCTPAQEANGFACPPSLLTIVMYACAILMFCSSTFFFTAPISGRIDFVRRLYAIFVGQILCNLTEAEKWLTGVSRRGYVVHFTLNKVIKYGFLRKSDLDNIESFSVVRNPYSRMVSIYMYNRFGPLESFEHFVESWYKKWKAYKKTGDTEEWNVYCHVLPMYEFTHEKQRQLIDCVVKQENLRGIVNGTLNECFHKDESAPIPPIVLQALRDMPHSNRRKRAKPWQDYYNRRTARLVYEMYKEDFTIFKYDAHIPGRPELDEALASTYFDADTDYLGEQAPQTEAEKEARQAPSLVAHPPAPHSLASHDSYNSETSVDVSI